MRVQAGAKAVNEGDRSQVEAGRVCAGRTGSMGLQALLHYPQKDTQRSIECTLVALQVVAQSFGHRQNLPGRGRRRGRPAAQRSIDLSSAYFVPDELTRLALIDSLKRGVKIRIITPEDIIDAETVRAASRGTWGRLLQAGAQIYAYQPSMYHCKVMIVDQLLGSRL